MTAALLAAIAGVILSLALSYLPGVGTWFNALDSQKKVMVNGLLLVVAAVGAVAAACSGLAVYLHLALECTPADFITVASALLSALLANQSAYVAFVKPFQRNNPAE